MKKRPIIMTGHSSVATKEGRKTQTRQVVVPQPPSTYTRAAWFSAPVMGWTSQRIPARDWHKVRCPYGVVGDRLWVVPYTGEPGPGDWWVYPPDHWDGTDEDLYKRGRWEFLPWSKPHTKFSPLFMPRWASRLLLEVTDVRAERIQEISCEDILAEGIEWPKDTGGKTNREVARTTFEALWNKINAKCGYGWNDNPWVFVISYKVIEGLAPAASHSV